MLHGADILSNEGTLQLVDTRLAPSGSYVVGAIADKDLGIDSGRLSELKDNLAVLRPIGRHVIWSKPSSQATPFCGSKDDAAILGSLDGFCLVPSVVEVVDHVDFITILDRRLLAARLLNVIHGGNLDDRRSSSLKSNLVDCSGTLIVQVNEEISSSGISLLFNSIVVTLCSELYEELGDNGSRLSKLHHEVVITAEVSSAQPFCKTAPLSRVEGHGTVGIVLHTFRFLPCAPSAGDVDRHFLALGQRLHLTECLKHITAEAQLRAIAEHVIGLIGHNVELECSGCFFTNGIIFVDFYSLRLVAILFDGKLADRKA